MAAWLFPVLGKGALFFAGAKGAQALYNKGESMIRRAFAEDDAEAAEDASA